MARDITVTLSDGSTHVYKGAPDNITPDAVAARAQQDFGQDVSHLDGGRSAPADAAPRWDILGDTGRAFKGAIGDAGQAISDEFSHPLTNDISPVGDVKRLGNVLKIPLDVAGAVASPLMGALHGGLGSALSYLLPKMSEAKARTKDFGSIGNFLVDHAPLISSDPKVASDQLIDQAAMGFAADPAAIAAAAPARAAASQARRSAQVTNQALAKVSQRALEDGLTPQQIIDAQTAGKTTGDQVTLMDIGNKNVRGLAGAVHRAPGEAGKSIDDFLQARDASATPALTGDIQSNVANGSTYTATQDLIKSRSAAAGPAYKEALHADSFAPFEDQFRTAVSKATGAKGQISKQISDIEQNNSGALAARGAAGADVRAKYMELRQQLDQAENDRQAAVTIFQKAKADGTANAPGATWSPRLQQFMDIPEVQAGIKQGLKLEKQDAITEGRPFKPSDYSIVGTDEAGDPIVGAVPTMKSLAVAKEGLDARIADMRDPLTGRPTKAGLSLKRLRDAFVNELDTINPRYKSARAAWEGPSQSMEAVRDGREHFSRSDSNEELKAEFDALSPANKDFYRLGAAEAKVDAVERAPDASDKSKRIINSERDRKRFRILFDSDTQAQRFIDSVARKRAAFETKQSIKGGSQTAGRIADDANENVPLALNAASGAGHILSGNILGTAHSLYRMKRELGLRNNPALNSEIAKILTNPDFTGGGNNIFAPRPVPKKIRNNFAFPATIDAVAASGNGSKR